MAFKHHVYTIGNILTKLYSYSQIISANLYLFNQRTHCRFIYNSYIYTRTKIRVWYIAYHIETSKSRELN